MNERVDIHNNHSPFQRHKPEHSAYLGNARKQGIYFFFFSFFHPYF
jgi:hypothetical protein